MIYKFKKPMQTVPAWVFVLIIAVLGLAVWPMAQRPAVVEVSPAMAMVRRAIDGVWVPAETEELLPLAVVVENSVDAWPISGINQANLVWEAPVEAGITRLLAVYADGEDVAEIGPVRSARPYFADWAAEFGALFAHVGGSPEALRIIPQRGVVDLNEFWNGEYFWRNGRARPHNVYTSTELLNQALKMPPPPGEGAAVTATPTVSPPPVEGEVEGVGQNTSQYEAWLYKEDAPPEGRGAAQEISVVFGNEIYTITWKYDPEANDYARWQLGRPYRDASGEQVRVKNVIVMETEVRILDEVGRRRIKTIGRGPVRLFRDGKEFAGEWRRPELEERTRFFDEEGVEVELNAGKTWIAVTHLAPVISRP